VALALLGLPWADGDEMGRLPAQPPDNLDQAASILKPEVPAGGIVSIMPFGANGVDITPSFLSKLA
jgi:hypothetical protein